MLEAEIQKLTAAVEALTAAINAQGAPRQENANEPVREPMPATTPDDIDRESPTATEQDTPPAPVTRDELRELCLSIVRANKEDKARVAATIKEFGGKVLKDVPDDKLADLKRALEAI